MVEVFLSTSFSYDEGSLLGNVVGIESLPDDAVALYSEDA